MGVLVAISIPIFTAQLEKAREATDQANIRSAYAEVSANMLTEDNVANVDPIIVSAKQTAPNWLTNGNDANYNIGGIEVAAKTAPNGNWNVHAVNNAGNFEVQIN